MGHTSKIFHLRGATHKCGAFLCLQVQLCDAKMRKGCYELVLGMVKNEF